MVQTEQLPFDSQQQLVHHETILKDGILPLMSNFPCEGHSRGYFADEMTDCKIFVQCNPNMDPHGFPFMERFVFQCPVETRWDQRLLTCVRTEDALPCPSSRLYWADTEMRFARFSDLPMQTIVPIPDGAMKVPIVQSQFIEQAPAAPLIMKTSQFVEQQPIKSAEIIEQLPAAQVIEPLPKLVQQVVEQAPIKSAQIVEQVPLPAPMIMKSQVIEQAPIKSTQVIEQLPSLPKMTQVVSKTNFPTKTVIRNNFGTKTMIKSNNFGTKTMVQKTVAAPMATKTITKSVQSFPTKTVQKTVSTSFPTKTVVKSFATKSMPTMTRTIQTVQQPAVVTRTISHSPMMTRTFFRSPIQHFRSIPGAFITRIA